MASDEEATTRYSRRGQTTTGGNISGAVYCLGFIGAAVHFIQQATSFWNGALGILKALVWPAILVYKLLEFLKV